MNPNIDYIPMSPLATAVRNTMLPTEHGGGAKKVIGVAAMVAIPFVAPAISASIASSGFLGASATGIFSTALGSAVVGAGLGGVASAATGGDWKRGALIGGISGGIAGYASTPSDVPVVDKSWSSGDVLNADGTITPASATTATTSAAPITTGVDTTSVAATDTTGFGPGDMADEFYADSASPAGFTGGPTTETSYADLGASDPGNMYDQTYADSASPATSGAGVNTASAPAPAPAPDPAPAPAPKTGWEGFKEGLSNAYSGENLGKMSMQMAGNALVNSMVGTSYTPEQQQLIDQRKAEVERLEAQGAEVDKIRLAEARKLLQQAMQVDPTYLARQKANAAKNQALRATNEAVRRAGSSGRQPGLVESVRRRGALASGKHSASAFDAGYQGGLQEKLALQESGLESLPDSKGLSGYYTSLGTQYANAEEARDKERAAYNSLFREALT